MTKEEKYYYKGIEIGVSEISKTIKGYNVLRINSWDTIIQLSLQGESLEDVLFPIHKFSSLPLSVDTRMYGEFGIGLNHLNILRHPNTAEYYIGHGTFDLELSHVEFNYAQLVTTLNFITAGFNKLGCQLMDNDLGDKKILLSFDSEMQVQYFHEVVNFINNAIAIIETSVITVIEKEKVNTITIPFELDEEFLPACKQYLIYFTQFLKDLGVNAKSAITDTDSKGFILNVTPEDKEESLKKIYDALNVYLKIPQSDELYTTDIIGQDPAAAQALAVAQNFKSQLTFAMATIEAQQKTIKALEEAPSKVITIEPDKKGDDEPLIPGLVDVTDWKLPGVKIKLQNILRWLKRNR